MPRRCKNIYKRKDRRWEAQYIKEISPEGKKKYGSVYAKSYKEVKAKQMECLLHLERNIYAGLFFEYKIYLYFSIDYFYVSLLCCNSVLIYS